MTSAQTDVPAELVDDSPLRAIPRQYSPENERLIRRDLLLIRLEAARGRRRLGGPLRRSGPVRLPEAP